MTRKGAAPELTAAQALAFMDRLRAEGEPVTRVSGGWVMRCPCCDEADALFISDPGAADPDGCPS